MARGRDGRIEYQEATGLAFPRSNGMVSRQAERHTLGSSRKPSDGRNLLKLLPAPLAR